MKKIIQVRIFKGEEQYVAECLDLPVVTQAKTLDELTENLREAISLHLRGEDLAELDLAVAGPLRYRLKLGDYVNPGTLLAHVGDGEVRSPAPGEVRTLRHKEGDVVAPGDALAELSADQNHVWEALRALLVVGKTDDLDDVRRFTQPVPGLPEKMARQAALTVRAIQARGK